MHRPILVPDKARGIVRSLKARDGYRSVRALAAAAGIKQSSLHRFLAGDQATMEVESFLALAHLFGVTVSELIGEVPLSTLPSTAREAGALADSMDPLTRSKWLMIGKTLAGPDPEP